MSQATLEDRVTDLEKTVANLIAELHTVDVQKDWRTIVGLFNDDPIAEAIDEEGRKIRQADRLQDEP